MSSLIDRDRSLCTRHRESSFLRAELIDFAKEKLKEVIVIYKKSGQLDTIYRVTFINVVLCINKEKIF